MLSAGGHRAAAALTAYAVEGELTSPKWARAWAKGAGCDLTRDNELLAGDVAMFGSPQRWDLLHRAQAEGRTWYYGDHAYWGRREYYRITRNAYQHDGHGPGDARRFAALFQRVRPWRREGRHILLCPNSPAFFGLHGLDCAEWVRSTARAIAGESSREIRVRFKSGPGSFESDLANAWAVVVFSSVCGVHAALEGVPCFATTECASRSFGSGDLTRIERPVRPDNRYEMACALAANQWTLPEMASGQAWRELNEQADRQRQG